MCLTLLVMKHKDLLPAVKAELEKRVGDLRQIAGDSGVAYDTVLRIKNGEGEPGYFKVRNLAVALGLMKRPAAQGASHG